LLELGDIVFGVDNLNEYYDPELKKSRLKQLLLYKNFKFKKIDISEKNQMMEVFSQNYFDCVLNLAAQAGVRYSTVNPYAYASSNLIGFLNILEGCRNFKVKHLVYASSSSVYGRNESAAFSELDPVNHPMSFYAATKRANELMAHSYSNLYELPTTGLRFFTVYGPWGRPDQALFIFVNAILNNKPIKIFNNGKMVRDFTYIDDVARGVIAAINNIPTYKENKGSSPNISSAPFQIFNIGNGRKELLLDFINEIENSLGIKAIMEFMPMQPGDIQETLSNGDLSLKELNYKSITNIKVGIPEFIKWYKQYYSSSHESI
jgi:UDP-glucuronate 4-epimerase